MAYRHPREDIGSNLMNIANGLNTIQAMGQRNTTFNQGQDDRAEAKQYKDDVNNNLQAM
jgi:hypothetical protein